MSKIFLGIEDEHILWRLDPEFVAQCVQGVDDQEAHAVLVLSVCEVAMLDDLETLIGKPVVSDVQACFWRCLRLAGHSDPVLGYGRLLMQLIDPMDNGASAAS